MHFIETHQKNAKTSCRTTRAAIGMIRMGAFDAHVTWTFGCSRVAVVNLINRYQQTSRTSDRPRTARPRVIAYRDDQYLRKLHLRNRFLTVTSSTATTYIIEIQTCEYTCIFRDILTIGSIDSFIPSINVAINM